MIEEKNVHLTKSKHIGLIIAGFLTLVIGLSTVIVLYAFGFLTSSSGYVSLVPNGDETVNYVDGVSASVFLEGTDMSVRQETTRANNTLTNALKKAYKVSDPTSRYDDTYSISYLNDSIGTDVEVGEDVYSILKDAYDATLSGSNYSVFAGPIEAIWQLEINAHIRPPVEEIDPLVDGSMAALLQELSAYISSQDHVRLTFKPGNVVRLDVSEEYRAYRIANGITDPIVSLNALRNAYEVKAVAAALEAEGFHDGYVTSDRGYGIALSGTPGLSHLINTPAYADYPYAGSVKVGGGHCFAKMHRYAYGGATMGRYYTLEHEGTTYYRSLYADLSDGMSNDTLLASYLFREGDDIMSLALEAEKSSTVHSLDGLRAYAAGLDEKTHYAFVLKDEQSSVYADSPWSEAISIRDPQQISLKTL